MLSAMYIKVDDDGDQRYHDRRDEHERESSRDRDGRDHRDRRLRDYTKRPREESGSHRERSIDSDRQDRLYAKRIRTCGGSYGGGSYGDYGTRGFDKGPSDSTSIKSSTIKPNAVLKGEEATVKNRSAEGRDMHSKHSELVILSKVMDHTPGHNLRSSTSPPASC